MRDNRLAAALLKQGRNVVAIPLYTPIRTDEFDVSRPTIYYGGLNVYLQHKLPLFRHAPQFLNRWLDRPGLLRAIGRVAQTRPQTLGPLTVSVLQGADGAQRRELDRLIDGLRPFSPTILHLPNLMFVGIAKALKAALNPSIFCSLAGEDIFLDALPDPHRRDAFDLVRAGAADVDAFVAPTRYYAAYAAKHFHLSPQRVHYVPLGVNADEFKAEPPSPHGPFIIGYLARVCSEKGLEVLCGALRTLRRAGRNCRLRAAGYLGPADRPYLAAIRKGLVRDGLGDAFEYVGTVSRAEKLAFLNSLHALSVPTIYPETKGLYVLEALASGVPVVQPRHGSFTEIIDATGGGLLYDPKDGTALTAALAQLMDDPRLRDRLAVAGPPGVRQNYTESIMAERTWSLYRNHAAR